MTTIAFLTIALTIYLFWAVFFELTVEHVAVYYAFVGVVALSPALVASGFAICYLMADRENTRYRMEIGMILILVAVVLLATWNTIYFVCLYDH